MRGRCPALLVAALLGVVPTAGADAAWRARLHRARVATDPAALCEAAIARDETRFATPPSLLTAISLVETGRPDHGRWRAWPWSVDVDGLPYVFPTRESAVAFTRTALLAGASSIDVGCMQVNLEQHPDAFATLDDGFDPRINVDYATRFLLSLHAGPAHLVWATAVGYYHSQTETLAAPYRARVIAIDATIAPDGTPPLATLAAAAPKRHTKLDDMKQAWAATLTSDDGTTP